MTRSLQAFLCLHLILFQSYGPTKKYHVFIMYVIGMQRNVEKHVWSSYCLHYNHFLPIGFQTIQYSEECDLWEQWSHPTPFLRSTVMCRLYIPTFWCFETLTWLSWYGVNIIVSYFYLFLCLEYEFISGSCQSQKMIIIFGKNRNGSDMGIDKSWKQIWIW